MLENLFYGLGVALVGQNLLFCLLGVLLGTMIGILPGLGPTATIALLLPFTYTLDPVASLIMLAGIYYGAQYGGSTTAILLNLPGEAASVVTCLDGHKMAQKGRAGAALTIAAVGSLFAGIVATFLIVMWGPALARVAQTFGSPEYFALMVLGVGLAVILAGGSLVNAIGAVLLGILIGTVGIDAISGVQRYTFGLPVLFDGIGFVPVAMGVFGLVEIIVNLERISAGNGRIIPATSFWVNREERRRSYGAVVRGTAMGSVLGLLPGGGATLGSFASYALERKISRRPEEFGHGAVEGLAGPESANNAAAQTSFIPLLTLGLPSNGIMALLMGAMLIHGITPGPSVMTARPDLFWGLVASMLVGNLMLVIINLPLVSIWIRLLRVPYKFMFPTIWAICCIGVYTINNSVIEVYIMGLFTLVGYIMRKSSCEGAPLLLGLILGPQLEEHLRRSLLLSGGEFEIFLQRPIAAVILGFALLLLLLTVLPFVRRKREETFAEAD